jgi:hypothetical protein
MYIKLHCQQVVTLTVRTQMKSKEPRNPPNRVRGCEEVSQPLYICIPEKINSDKTEDKASEVPLEAAIKI